MPTFLQYVAEGEKTFYANVNKQLALLKKIIIIILKKDNPLFLHCCEFWPVNFFAQLSSGQDHC